MKTITLALQKGGTGKTSISVAIAAELATKGKTLLIDADPQGNATTWISSTNIIDNELSDVLNGKCDYSAALQKTNVENLYIIATAGLDGGLREYQKTRASSAPFAFLDITDKAKETFDYCVIDTAPNFDPLNESVFVASDDILTVLQFNEFSRDGFQIFTENLADAKKRLRIPADKARQNKIILNAKDDRIKQQTDILNVLQELEKLNYKLFVIPVDQAFNKSQAMHVSIQELTGTKAATLDAIKAIARAVENGRE